MYLTYDLLGRSTKWMFKTLTSKVSQISVMYQYYKIMGAMNKLVEEVSHE